MRRRVPCPLGFGFGVLLVATSCNAPGTRHNDAELPQAPLRIQLDAGSVLQLLPTTSTQDSGRQATLAGALWREALRQSLRFDVAAGTEDTASSQQIALHHDPASSAWSSTLRQPDRPPLPLASETGEFPDVIDALALATRQALGERVNRPPMRCSSAYSGDVDCVALTERALVDISRGHWKAATARLRRARSHDPGSTLTLAALARTLLALGKSRGDRAMIGEAHRVAVEALSVSKRLAPTTQHRLLHVAVVAGAPGAGSPASDRELLVLGDIGLAERPYDPYPLLSRAVALNFLSRYDESAPLLRRLATRWPQSAEVAHHLTYAELASGRPEAALAAIRSAQSRLPRAHLVVPTSVALFHCDRHQELQSYLADLVADPTLRKSSGLHELRLMQAAHALLTDRRADAVQVMLEDLEWVRQRPSRLNSYALDVADTGQVLVRMGHHLDLLVPLQAFEQLSDLPPTFAQAMVFLGGLVQVAQDNERAEAAEAHLLTNGRTVWSSLVRAAAHRRRGELNDELRERIAEYKTTESPLVRASLARVLTAYGDTEHAAETLKELRERLLAFRMRRMGDHPLMRPATALAYLATNL